MYWLFLASLFRKGIHRGPWKATTLEGHEAHLKVCLSRLDTNVSPDQENHLKHGDCDGGSEFFSFCAF